MITPTVRPKTTIATTPPQQSIGYSCADVRSMQRRLDLRGPSRPAHGPRSLRGRGDGGAESGVPQPGEADRNCLPEVQALTRRDRTTEHASDPLQVSRLLLPLVGGGTCERKRPHQLDWAMAGMMPDAL